MGIAAMLTLVWVATGWHRRVTKAEAGLRPIQGGCRSRVLELRQPGIRRNACGMIAAAADPRIATMMSPQMSDMRSQTAHGRGGGSLRSLEAGRPRWRCGTEGNHGHTWASSELSVMMELAVQSWPAGIRTRTSAVSVARLTEAVVTASCPSSTRFTRDTQPPHIISAALRLSTSGGPVVVAGSHLRRGCGCLGSSASRSSIHNGHRAQTRSSMSRQ